MHYTKTKCKTDSYLSILIYQSWPSFCARDLSSPPVVLEMSWNTARRLRPLMAINVDERRDCLRLQQEKKPLLSGETSRKAARKWDRSLWSPMGAAQQDGDTFTGLLHLEGAVSLSTMPGRHSTKALPYLITWEGAGACKSWDLLGISGM